MDVTLVDEECGRPAIGHKDYTDVTSLNGFCAERISERESFIPLSVASFSFFYPELLFHLGEVCFEPFVTENMG